MMWGDPERAASMEQGGDQLATLLFQISSPAHIPWGDQRWQELLHGYDVWVHIDDNNPLVEQACRSMVKHAEVSSNLAALSLHVTRMMRDLTRDVRTLNLYQTAKANAKSIGEMEDERLLVADFSKRISCVAKARATAGALQVLRLLCHPVIVEASKDSESSVANTREVFTYHTRGDLISDQQAGYPLLHSLLDFISTLGMGRNAPIATRESDQNILRTPEIYDSAVFSFQLLFVLCGTQLYQPFQSSFERFSSCHYFLEEVFRQPNEDDGEYETTENNNLQIFWSSNRSGGSGSTRSIGNGSSNRINKRSKLKQRRAKSGRRRLWTPRAILETCLDWQLHRPSAPERSIAHYYYVLAKSAVDAKGGEKPGQDGLYENYMVVQAVSPNGQNLESDNGASDASSDLISMATSTSISNDKRYTRANGRASTKRNSLIVDTTRGILTLSGSIIFLPFRLVSLVYGVFRSGNGHDSNDLNRAAIMKKLNSARYSRTRDILWLSDTLLADLACSLILLLVSNNRNGEKNNAFRVDLKNLTDNRWNSDNERLGLTLPDLPIFSDEGNSIRLENVGMTDQNETESLSTNPPNQKISSSTSSIGESPLTLNFESLFLSFGNTLHTELGALLLYTILQSSPSVAESLAVRSDLDNLVMPLLRTLYFAARSNTFMAKDYGTKRRSSSGTTTLDIRSCPFRTQSQLYVIIILLLIFSQDSSFGRDVFRRAIILTVPWYKERNLKCINLGSVVILTLLRLLVFTLNRLDDVFLMNNCCAVLENLAPSVADLHEYAAMRLVSVTVNVMKKHAKLALAASHNRTDTGDENDGNVDDKPSNSNDPLEMHAEVAHCLLGLIRNGLSPKNVEDNKHLIYALVYHQADLLNLSKLKHTASKKKKKSTTKKKLYASAYTSRIVNVILKASELIQGESARSAPKALKTLERQMNDLKEAVLAADNEIANKSSSHRKPTSEGANHAVSKGSDAHYGGDEEDIRYTRSNSNSNALLSVSDDDFTYSYEEEADPEVFFVPYVWDLIVSAVTASTVEWKKDNIQAFALLDKVNEDEALVAERDTPTPDASLTSAEFSKNADEMV
mmetsp:Transcript_9312/g.27802  ORF Transcript_9312/g.27802 Transcript_9312/m.27802 type:complete len:1080 (-) Transcript_9312:865-4104(-)